MYKTIRKFAVAMAIIAGLASRAEAVPLTFTITDGELSATATFEVVGNQLFVTLTNTGTGTSDFVPVEVLSGVLFDIGTSVYLSPVSALLPAGSTIVQADECNPGPCAGVTNVGGEFGIADDLSGAGDTWDWAIGANGQIGGTGEFGGANLDNPNALNGMNFGLVPTGFDDGDGNTGMDSEPFIRNSVNFVLNILTAEGGTATTFDQNLINNVAFLYGTSFTVLTTNGVTTTDVTTLITEDVVPEPGSLILLGTGLALAGRRFRRRKS